FRLNTRVTDIGFGRGPGGKTVERIRCSRGGMLDEIAIEQADLVFVTLGSMVEASSSGSMTTAAKREPDDKSGAWSLWESLAAANPEFGNPQAFDSDIDGSQWLSFTTTLHEPT